MADNTYGLVKRSSIQGAANAIRRKTGGSGTITPAGLEAAIDAIQVGGNYQTKQAVSSTDDQTITPDAGFDAMSSVEISGIPAQAETVTPTGSAQTVSGNNFTVTIAGIDLPYADVSGVTASGSDVRSGKTIVGSDGSEIPGSATDYSGKSVSASDALIISGGPAPNMIEVKTSTSGFFDAGTSFSKIGYSFGDARKKDVRAGKTFTSNYANVESAGTATDHGSVSETIPAGGSWTGGAGFYDAIEIQAEQGGSTIVNQDKTVTSSTEQQIVRYDAGYTGLGSVTVEPIPAASDEITPDGTTQTASANNHTVTVNPVPTETGSAVSSTTVQTITPTAGKYFDSVRISPIPATGQTIYPSDEKQLAYANNFGVTVMPVPTEEKTANSGVIQSLVTPTAGKYLSKVTIEPVPVLNPTVVSQKTWYQTNVGNNVFVAVDPIPDQQGSVSQTIDPGETWTGSPGYYDEISVTANEGGGGISSFAVMTMKASKGSGGSGVSYAQVSNTTTHGSAFVDNPNTTANRITIAEAGVAHVRFYARTDGSGSGHTLTHFSSSGATITKVTFPTSTTVRYDEYDWAVNPGDYFTVSAGRAASNTWAILEIYFGG